ncbi:hypothetical protein [Salinilacihabitans rarus]|uniref:hypothetical protein n=1 Tax=Salinilacihabitans rarus TaxID=2961596 RepID=UPI0020C89244|nr:hypothetical protein [Salinilacihabitans rarus]
MRRRQFLASGTALLSVAIAGCGHPPVVLDMDDATADGIAGEVSMTAVPGSEEYAVVTSARENGSATRAGRHALFDHTDTVRVEDAFYDVSETRLGSSEVTVYEVRVDFDPDDPTPELGEIEYDDLPETDRRRLDAIVSDDPPSQDGYDLGVGYGTAEEVGDGSVFVPEQQYDVLVYDGDRYRVAVDSRTASEVEYRYEATEVAPDVETFADRVRAQYLFALTGLSEAERAVVEEAIDGGYFEDDDAFRSVVDRIREHEGLDVDDFYGTWLVEYEGVEYLTYAEW